MLFGRIRGTEAFQMIGALPFALPDDVDMGEDTSSLFLQLTWRPSLDTWSTPGLGHLPRIPSSTSLDGTSGMPPSADFLDPPTWRKGGTTVSKVLSTAPTRRSGASWMHSSWNIHSQS